MTNSLFSYILKYSKRQQLTLVALIILAFPFYYLSLDLPKTIINDAINGSNFPVELSLGFQISLGEFEQLPYLMLLCLGYLVLVVINGGIKYFINVYRGVLGERMLRRLRFQLIERIMKFPLARFRHTSQGELVSMVNQETEPLSGFIGQSFSLPLYQGGMMITILIFMFAQDWVLGIAAIALYPLQSWLIPKMQKQVNLLNRERTLRLRKLAENLGETVAGINEIRVNDSSEFFKAQYSDQLGGIFETRVQIFKKKFLIKFLNSFIGQITPFLFFLIGGMLVIRGELSFGALVAVLAAYKDLSSPWKELLTWYQLQADARMKYSILVEQFDVEYKTSLSENALVAPSADQLSPQAISVKRVSLEQPDGTREVNGVSLSIEPGDWVRLVGSGSSGAHTLAHIFARLVHPSSGEILFGENNALLLPGKDAGRIVGYIGHDSYLFSTTIRDNLLISLKHQAQSTPAGSQSEQTTDQFRRELEEARLSGNSEISANADWVDYQRAGVADASQLDQRVYSVLKTVDLEDDLLRYALAKTIDPAQYPELESELLQARQVFRSQIEDNGLHTVVESLNPDQYNDNATVAENMLFGTARDAEFAMENIAEHPLIRSLLHEHKLDETFDAASLSIAGTMVELFSDLPPGHEFFDRYSFVDPYELPALGQLLQQIDTPLQINELNDSDRRLLRSLPFRIILGQHRLSILEEADKEKILQIRKKLAQKQGAAAGRSIDFFSPDSYSPSSSIGENIMFGRIAFGRLGAADRVHREQVDVLQSRGLIPRLLDVALAEPAGLAGSNLPISRRQKLALARALLKNPDLLVVNQGLNSLDVEGAQLILNNIKNDFPQLSLLWVDTQTRFEMVFDQTVIMEAGEITSSHMESEQADAEEISGDENSAINARTSDSVEENEKVALLRNIPMFRLLDRSGLQLLANTCVALDVPKGKRLFNQGDVGDALYAIVAGRASIIVSRGSTELILSERGSNQVIGELALLMEEPRSASVVAVTDMVVLRLGREAFIDMVRANGEFGYQLLQVVSTRLVEANRQSIGSIQKQSEDSSQTGMALPK